MLIVLSMVLNLHQDRFAVLSRVLQRLISALGWPLLFPRPPGLLHCDDDAHDDKTECIDREDKSVRLGNSLVRMCTSESVLAPARTCSHSHTNPEIGWPVWTVGIGHRPWFSSLPRIMHCNIGKVYK